MGVAAYNRGSRAIREQIGKDFPARPVEFELMDRFNAIPKNEDAGTPFGDVRIVNDKGVWWIECPKTGYGYWYKTLTELMRRWNVEITGMTGAVYLASPLKSNGTRE